MVQTQKLAPCASATPAAVDWHPAFLAMLPKIMTYARVAFRAMRPEARAEAVQEVVANALVAYVGLVNSNRTHAAYPSALARFAVAQFWEGRRVGTKKNIRDVLSPQNQRRNHFTVKRLDRFDPHECEWRDAVVEDHHTPVADQAAFRIDFPAWLARLSRRSRRIALRLAVGAATKDVAERYALSQPRISQLRSEFHTSWQAFHGEIVAA